MAPTALPNILAADLPSVLPADGAPAATSPAAAIASGASPQALASTLQATTQAQAKNQVTGIPMKEVAPLESNAMATLQSGLQGTGPSIRPGSAAARMQAGGSMDAVDQAGKIIPQIAGAIAPGSMFEPIGEAITAARAARAAKLVNSADEWQKINGVLDLPKTGVIVSPSAATAADAVKMPGRTLAQLGYSADDLKKMDPMVRMNVIDSHLQNAGAAIQNAARQATQERKTVDLSGVVTNVFKNVTDPAMKAKMIDQFYEKAKSLGISLPTVTPENALALRRALREGQTFSGFSDAKTTANISKQLGSAVSGELKKAVPDFVNLDQDYTDLSGARKAAISQVQNTLKKAPEASTLQKVGSFAVNKVLPRVAQGAAVGAGYEIFHSLRDLIGGGQP